MRKTLTVDHFIERLKSKTLTDERTGQNTLYEVTDAALAAFSMFYMQSGSFLAGQKHLEQIKGTSNANTVFQMDKIPTTPQIRNLLDPVAPEELAEEFRYFLRELEEAGHLSQMKVLDQRLAFSLDGVYYFCSQKVSCQQCQTQTLKNGDVLYKHSAITPVVVSPQSKVVLPYVPEYIVPQDGKEKQDCEREASKRWVSREQDTLRQFRAVLLGDDLYSNQPLCEAIIEAALHFIFVCHRDSHQTLYQVIDAVDALGNLPTLKQRHWNGQHGEIWTYRYLTQLPLRQGDDALLVNWCDLTITHEETEDILFVNEWVTNLTLTDETVVEVATVGRARWKSENENNNILKNQGYALKHNFGHGKQHLATTLLTLNLYAFLLHTIAQLADATYRLIRRALGKRRTFFEDVRALMRYLLFDSWHHLLNFMFVQLELVPD